MKLAEYPGRLVRPTKAVVRKSLFQIMEPWAGKQVCDLYAGIGSLGIEAASRGATGVLFVESDRQVREVLVRNTSRVLAEVTCEIHAGKVMQFLKHSDRQFHVVLADPPYGTVDRFELFAAVQPILGSDGVFAMEFGKGEQIPGGGDIRSFGQSYFGIWRKSQ